MNENYPGCVFCEAAAEPGGHPLPERWEAEERHTRLGWPALEETCCETSFFILLKEHYLAGVYACNMETDFTFLLATNEQEPQNKNIYVSRKIRILNFETTFPNITTEASRYECSTK